MAKIVKLSHHLANGGVAGQDVGILHDGLVGGHILANLDDAPPLGKVAAIGLVLGAPDIQVIQPLGGALALLSPKQLLDTLVHLDAGHQAQLLDHVHKPVETLSPFSVQLVLHSEYSTYYVCYSTIYHYYCTAIKYTTLTTIVHFI
jgi:hypothetical protein